MKKKGFTLIELLAVIVILGIITVIAVPKVLDIINKSRESAASSSIKLVKDAIKTQVASSDLTGPVFTKETDGCYIFNFDDQTSGNAKALEIKNKDKVTGSIKYCNNTFSDDTLKFDGNSISKDEPKGKIICKRATTLHTEECTQTDGSMFCSGAGYTASGSKGTSTITYGNLGTSGTLTTGDSFDCDVNGDGVYDSATERFYYVTDLTTYQNTAVLVYYGNSSSTGVSLNNRSQYYANGNIYSGPITAVNQLPTRSAWPRVGLIVRTAQIYNYEGGTTVTEQTSSTTSVTHNLPKYTYTTAARLLTYQEFRKITDNSFFWENFGGSAASCIWLNTTHTNANSKQIFAIQNPNGTLLSAIPKDGTSTTSLCGVRPVIEVLKSDMIY